MNKKSFLQIMLNLVFLVVFDTVFFLIAGFEHVPSVWLSFGFIHFAYLMVIVTSALVKKSSNAYLFGLPIYVVSTIYFLVELAIGLIFIALKLESIKAPLVVQIIVAGAYAVALFTNLIANESSDSASATHEGEVAYLTATTTNVQALLEKSDDKKVNKAIERVYDLLHASPVKSNPAAKQTELQIVREIGGLERAVALGDNEAILFIAKELEELIAQRNYILKRNQ